MNAFAFLMHFLGEGDHETCSRCCSPLLRRQQSTPKRATTLQFNIAASTLSCMLKTIFCTRWPRERSGVCFPLCWVPKRLKTPLDFRRLAVSDLQRVTGGMAADASIRLAD
jgi:hypothetical protein